MHQPARIARQRGVLPQPQQDRLAMPQDQPHRQHEGDRGDHGAAEGTVTVEQCRRPGRDSVAAQVIIGLQPDIGTVGHAHQGQRQIRVDESHPGTGPIGDHTRLFRSHGGHHERQRSFAVDHIRRMLPASLPAAVLVVGRDPGPLRRFVTVPQRSIRPVRRRRHLRRRRFRLPITGPDLARRLFGRL